jgi:P pilus assembly chaperone PapD
MNRYFLRFGAALLLMIGMTYPTFAAVNLDRTRIIYNASDKSVSVMLENQSKDLPYLAQVWLENEQGEKITSPLVALPPMQRIDAGQKSQIRILQLPETAGLPKDRESLFYFNVREVPPKSDMANVMQVAIQSRVKLFFRPVELRKLVKGHWQEQLQVARLDRRYVGKPTVEVIASAASTRAAVAVGLRRDTSTSEAGEQNCGAYETDEMRAAHWGTPRLG